jgi:hypothetical protein
MHKSTPNFDEIAPSLIDDIFETDRDMKLDLDGFGRALQKCCLAYDLSVKDPWTSPT